MFALNRLVSLAELGIVRKLTDAGYLHFARRRVAELDRVDLESTQTQTLLSLIRKATHTTFGLDHDFASIHTVADYQARVPLRDYSQYWEQYWGKKYPELQGTTWPDFIPYYALSSGTTSGTTKYLPITHDMVASNKKAALTMLALFRHAHPQAKTFAGKVFFLGGSTELRTQADGSFAGDLSGIAAKEVYQIQRAFTFPSLELSLISDWDVKLKKLAAASLTEPITAISGVPSWMLKVFDSVLELSGKSTLIEAWPDLRMVIHGGTLFDPYRETFRKIIGDDRVKFCEVYPCSEGFLATEDPRYGKLRIIPDHGIFFEFVPVDELESDKPTRHTLATAQLGVRYAVVVTTCAGLFSYIIGDTITFESLAPPLIRFTGRTKFFLSAFGEHLIQEEIDKAMLVASQQTGTLVEDYHVGPIFPTDTKQPGRHRYYVEFRGPPAEQARFTEIIDAELNRLNEDYAAHRVGDLTMLMPEMIVVPHGGFAAWMKSRGKYGGQNKVPRMDNTGTITTQLGDWLSTNYPALEPT